MKKILITGKGSYIGTSFINWVQTKHPGEFQFEELDMIGDYWKKKDFSGYDTVFHVAGIAHVDVGKVSAQTEKLYYKVNCDLAVETAKKAKESGVKQFVFMSSMIIYGESARMGQKKVITAETEPCPANFYGDSKWKADKEIRKLEDSKFKIAVVRPPMIYGKGSKGNYTSLTNLSKKLPIFPDIENERSMLYIDNLSEFLFLLVKEAECGIFFPQNKEYVNTSRMVRLISKENKHKIWFTKILSPVVFLLARTPGRVSILANKAFGNIVYDAEISRCFGGEYQIKSLEDSIRETEREKTGKVLLMGNHEIVIYNFRHELIKRLLDEGYDIAVALPYGPKVDILRNEGCEFFETKVDRRGRNVYKDLLLFVRYLKIIKHFKPSCICTYTIKPNIYGGIAARLTGTPCIANITGMGSSFESSGIIQKMVMTLYKTALKKNRRIFFQNKENMDFFKDINSPRSIFELLPGSGVNLQDYKLQSYTAGVVRFAFIGRIMKEKGIEEFIYASEKLKPLYPMVEFHVFGFCEENYQDILFDLQQKNILSYHGMVSNMKEAYKEISCIVLPSYHEGMSNVLLEAAATGRPAIATDISGCKEIIVEEETGFLIKRGDKEDLLAALEKFIGLPWEDKKMMGLCARKRVEQYFDRNIIVERYLKSIIGDEQE